MLHILLKKLLLLINFIYKKKNLIRTNKLLSLSTETQMHVTYFVKILIVILSKMHVACFVKTLIPTLSKEIDNNK